MFLQRMNSILSMNGMWVNHLHKSSAKKMANKKTYLFRPLVYQLLNVFSVLLSFGCLDVIFIFDNQCFPSLSIICLLILIYYTANMFQILHHCSNEFNSYRCFIFQW